MAKPPKKPAAKKTIGRKPVKAAVRKPAARTPAAKFQPVKAAPKKPKAPAKAPVRPAPKPTDPAVLQLKRLVAALLEKKGLAITSIHVAPVVGFADYYLVATGTSSRHNQTLADAVVESETKAGHRKPRREGYDTGNWIVADAGDVIVHIFDEASRHYYDLERLFLDSERRLYGEDGKVVELPRMGAKT